MRGDDKAFPLSHCKGQSQGLNLSLKSLEQNKNGSLQAARFLADELHPQTQI